MTAFALTADALHGEPWRLWTGHLAHYDLEHVLVNALAALPPLLLLRHERRRWRWVILWAATAAPLISLAILAGAPGVEYRGASAIVIGLWVLAPARVLLVAAFVKLCIESLTPVHFTGVSVPPLVLAHWAGAIAGLLPVVFDRLVNLRSVHQVEQLLDVPR